MKKNNLIKVILLTLLTIIVLSIFVRTSTISGLKATLGEVNSVGFAGIAQVFYSAISDNLDILVFVVLIGMMYGVLNKTDAYQQLVSRIAKKFKSREKILLVAFSILFAIISSVFGLQFELLVFVPFVSAILMYVGYDKKTVFATTIGSILIGSLGATFSNTALSTINQYYNFSYTYQIVTKSFVLIVVMYLFITHVIKNSILSTEIEYLEIPNYEIPSKNKRKVLPVIVYIILLFLLILFGTFKLGDIVGIEIFSNIKENLLSIPCIKAVLGEVPVFSAFGYIDIAYMLLICSLVVGFIYNISLDSMIDGMYKGGKRVLGAAVVLLIVSSISYITINYSFYITIVAKLLSFFDSFNIFISAVVTFVSSLFVSNIANVSSTLLPLINATTTSDMNALALIVQTVFGLVMLIAPTSALLMFGLAYYKIDYTDWFKYIIKLFIYILVVLMAIFIITVLI